MKTQNKNIQYANLGKRLKAFAYDYLIIFVYIVVLAGVNYGLVLSGRGLENISPWSDLIWVQDLFAFLTLILPVILYFTIQESSPKQATWGKRKAGLRVISTNGSRLSRGKAFLRSTIKFLPWQIAHTSIYQAAAAGFGNELPLISQVGFALTYLLVGIFVISALISKNHHTLYDLAAGSYVVSE